MDDNAAIIAMVDSNMQRENILPLPSERAKAYKLKMDAIKKARDADRYDFKPRWHKVTIQMQMRRLLNKQSKALELSSG